MQKHLQVAWITDFTQPLPFRGAGGALASSICCVIHSLHRCQTRDRDDVKFSNIELWLAFEHLTLQVGARLVNRLPEDVKGLDRVNPFKARLQRYLVFNAFYFVDEFVEGSWEHCLVNLDQILRGRVCVYEH